MKVTQIYRTIVKGTKTKHTMLHLSRTNIHETEEDAGAEVRESKERDAAKVVFLRITCATPEDSIIPSAQDIIIFETKLLEWGLDYRTCMEGSPSDFVMPKGHWTALMILLI